MKIAVCVDRPIVRDALVNTLNNHEDLNVEFATSDDSYFHEALSTNHVDVALIGLQDAHRAINVAHQLRQAGLGVKAVMLVEKPTEELRLAAARVGIADVVWSGMDAEEIFSHIWSVGNGNRSLDARTVHSLETELTKKGLWPLINIGATDREILECLCQGMSDKEIAAHVYLSSQTVRNRISAILHRCGKQNRTQLALMYSPLMDLFTLDNVRAAS